MRYTKKQRDEAILICAIAASTPAVSDTTYRAIEDWLDRGRYTKPWRMAVAAIIQAVTWAGRHEAYHAEAECLLRDGWSPGDPVEVRR